MIRRTLRPLAPRLAGLLLVLACSDRQAPPPPSVPVTIAPAEVRDVPLELTAPGTVEPLQTVTVRAQVTGTLTRVRFAEGDEVREGQILFELDPRPFRAALAQAEAVLARDRAQLANARVDAARYDTLAAQQFVTLQQRDQARTLVASLEATVAADEAAVEQARLNLQYATIRAPISGRAGGLLVRPGNLVRANADQPLVVINQLRPILVRFAVPAEHLGRIREFQPRGITVEARPAGGGPVSTGRLTFVDNAVDTSTGTILLKARFDNADNALWPGQFVNVRARLTTERERLIVPATAVVNGPSGPFVFVVKPDSTATVRPVHVERTTDSLAVLADGVSPGDQVVTDGQLRLREGARVQIRTGAPRVASEAP